MSNDSEKFRDAREHIDIEDPEDIRFWASRLQCREEDLRVAVECCGPGAAGVREFIRGMDVGRQQPVAELRAQELTASLIARGKTGTRAG